MLWLWASLALSAEPLMLDTVLQSLDGRQPKVAQAIADQLGAQAALLEARGGFDPKIKGEGKGKTLGYYDWLSVDSMVQWDTSLWGSSVTAGWRYGQGEMPSYELDRYTLDQGEFAAELSVPLLRGGPYDERRADRDQAEAGLMGAQAGQVLTNLVVEQQARLSWWGWVAAGERLHLAQELMENAERRQIAVNERVEAGAIPELDRVEAERVVASRQADLAKAQLMVTKAAQKLSLYYRDNAGTPIVPAVDELPDLPESEGNPQSVTVPDAVQRAWAMRPELVMLDAEIEAAQAEARLAGVGLLPQLDATVGLSQDLGAVGSGDVDFIDKYGQTELTGGVKLEVPLTFRKERGKQRKARAKVASLQAKRQWAADELSADVQQAEAELTASWTAWRAAQQSAELALRLEDAERERYELGATDLFRVFLREQSFAEATRKAIAARLDWESAVIRYRFLTTSGAASVIATGKPGPVR